MTAPSDNPRAQETEPTPPTEDLALGQTLATALSNGPVALTQALVDVYSESHHEQALVDGLEPVLRSLAGVEVTRRGNTLVARTQRGLGDRVVLAGHIDTVPPANNCPGHRGPDPITGEDTIFGLGSVDMKSGAACYLHAFAVLANAPELQRDMTLVLYEGEEVASRYNGLNHLVGSDPDLLQGSVALLGEPTGGIIEAGCQGTIRVKIIAHGARAHSARSWLGHNALHGLARVIARVAEYQDTTNHDVVIDGLKYREGCNAVMCESGVATNTIPDAAWAFVNFRYAPHRDVDAALAALWDILKVGTPEQPAEGFTLEIDDISPAAMPGLDRPAAAALVAATGGQVRAKYGWTDVARFTALGIPAVNFGPGDPGLCHTVDERCPVQQIEQVSSQLIAFLTGNSR